MVRTRPGGGTGMLRIADVCFSNRYSAMIFCSAAVMAWGMSLTWAESRMLMTVKKKAITNELYILIVGSQVGT